MGGVDALSGDPVRQLVLSARVEAAWRFRQLVYDHQAVRIAERIGELFTE